MIDKALASSFKKLITSQELVCLSCVNTDGMPETRAMLNLANPQIFPSLQTFFAEGFITYFSTNTSSQKIKQLAVNKRSSIYYYSPVTFEGLLFMGETEVVDDKQIKEAFWQESWSMYYKKGVHDPDYTLLRFTPRRYKYYNGNLAVQSGIV